MTRIVTLTLNPAIDVATSVPRLEPVVKLRCRPEVRSPGGGGINVARVAQRLGADVLAVHAAGGATGRMLGELLAREALPALPLPVAGDTRECVTVIDDATAQEYRFVMPGPLLPAKAWRDSLSTLDNLEGPIDWLVASGSLPPGAPDDLYALVGAWARRRGVRFAIDTAGAALAAVLAPGPAGPAAGATLAKPNLRELQDLCGRALAGLPARVAACRGLIAGGAVQVIALSMGSEGALLVDADAAWHSGPLDVVVRSSVGAGDSFLGALLWSMSRGDAPPDALAWAVAAGTAALLQPGTQLAHVDDMRPLRAAVRVRAV